LTVEIIDVHAHVMRSEDHGREMWSYFLSRRPATGHPAEPPAYHTVEESERLMDSTGIVETNILMFTWSGRYWRDGLYTLPDTGPRRHIAAEELRQRVVERIIDNNEWAVQTVAEHPRFSTFIGVNPALMTADEMLTEVNDKIGRGALGVKMVPQDTWLAGNDRRLWPLYEYLAGSGVPMLSEASGRPGAPGNPALFREALERFPSLKLIFAHLGHDPQFGAGADQTVVELARRFTGVHTDISLRLPEMLKGACTPEEFVAHLRKIGTDRVFYGTNFGFLDCLHSDPDHRPDEGPQTTWAKRTRQAFVDLPLDEEERTAIASGNWRRLTVGVTPTA
jgi:predicted TIM-barrel fold metal-dependent hydrolase